MRQKFSLAAIQEAARTNAEKLGEVTGEAEFLPYYYDAIPQNMEVLVFNREIGDTPVTNPLPEEIDDRASQRHIVMYDSRPYVVLENNTSTGNFVITPCEEISIE